MADAKIDTTNLAEKLEGLTGHDFEAAERQERLAGNPAVDMTFSRSFQSRLAAIALKCNPHDLKDLPLREYLKVMREVSGFLFAGSEKEEILSESSEE